MSMKELEKMVRRAKSTWKPGCNDRNAAEYSIAVVNAAAKVVAKFEAYIETIGTPCPPSLAEAVEAMRDALYPKAVAQPTGDDEQPVMARQVSQSKMDKEAEKFTNPFDAMKKKMEDAA